ncbi:MAG: hypothetical protein QME51_00945, partial [Planctomycetota bacterium]|nr:hypothetical protein [Planctomycetota bacterium]
VRRAPKKYFRGREIGYQKKTFNKKIERLGKERYAESLMKTGRPLDGYKTGRGKMIKGLPSLGMMALTGDKELLKYLKKEDKIDPVRDRSSQRDDRKSATPTSVLVGDKTKEKVSDRASCISNGVEGELVCAVDKVKGFRKLLRNKLVYSGAWILKTNYKEKIIRMMNERINKLVDGWRAEGIAPFSPDGDSHINFRMVETPDPSRQGGTDKKIKRLVLDIQVATL